MHSVTRSFLVLLTVLGILSLACAGGSDHVRPKQLNADQNSRDAQCTPEILNAPNGAERFVVEWQDSDRASLESEMHKGVALVKYTCDGIRVLRSCAVPGTYGYRASNSKKVGIKQFTDAFDASTNLSSPILGAKFQAELDQGRALNLAYVMIGSKTTSVTDVSRDQLNRAACLEATHFVYETHLGAFVMESAEQGEVVAAAQMLGFTNADGSISSSRKSLFSDGDAHACDQASPDDSQPPHGCGALMHVHIMPLIEGKTDAASAKKDALRSTPTALKCPTGTALDSGVCVKPANVQSNICTPGDFEGCQALCQTGNFESCDRLAVAYTNEFSEASDNDQLITFLGNLAPYLPLFKQACIAGDKPNACTFAGLMTFFKIAERDFYEISFQEIQRILETSFYLISNGCKLGDMEACAGFYDLSQLMDAGITRSAKHHYGNDYQPTMEKFGPRAVKVITDMCAAGEAQACLEVAKYRAQK